jgi:hypothetical protein
MVSMLVTSFPADVTMAYAMPDVAQMAAAAHVTPGSMHDSSVSAPSPASPWSRLAAEFQAAFIMDSIRWRPASRQPCGTRTREGLRHRSRCTDVRLVASSLWHKRRAYRPATPQIPENLTARDAAT